MIEQSPALLVVDDDADIVSSLSIHLRADGYRVLKASGGTEAIAALSKELPALAIVDLMMPGMDGFETSRQIKRRADIPIIILTAVDTPAVKVEAIERYAEDYLTKPFNYAELAARIQRILKRVWPAGPPASATEVDSDLTIDFAAQVVRYKGDERKLSPIETRLLHLLWSNAGRILPTELILDRVWPDAEGEPGYLWEYIRRLRHKLGDDPNQPRYIASERGIGYGFLAPTNAPPAPPAR